MGTQNRTAEIQAALEQILLEHAVRKNCQLPFGSLERKELGELCGAALVFT